MLIPRIVEVTVVGPHALALTFEDGLQKRVDLLPLLRGPIFAPLLRPDFFARVTLDAIAGTTCWPNGADISPEVLYELPDVNTATASLPR